MWNIIAYHENSARPRAVGGDQTEKPYETAVWLEQGHLKHVEGDYTITSTDVLLRK
jgi:hypothetical protein